MRTIYIECPHCEELINPEILKTCPYCHSQIPRFYTITRMPDEDVKPHSHNLPKLKEVRQAEVPDTFSHIDDPLPRHEDLHLTNLTVQSLTPRDLSDWAHSRKIRVLVFGFGGVGKTTLVRAFNPQAANQVVLENGLTIQHTIHRYVFFDFDFPGCQGFRYRWQQGLRNAQIILLITDSSLSNVLQSKDFVNLLRAQKSVPIIAIANKQDSPDALNPTLVQRILGIPTLGTIATYAKQTFQRIHQILDAYTSHSNSKH